MTLTWIDGLTRREEGRKEATVARVAQTETDAGKREQSVELEIGCNQERGKMLRRKQKPMMLTAATSAVLAGVVALLSLHSESVLWREEEKEEM